MVSYTTPRLPAPQSTISNEIAVGMVVLKPGEMGHGTMSKMYFDENNTIFEINDIIEKL